MIETTAPTERHVESQEGTHAATRINCEATGRPKLLVSIMPDSIWCWCKICHTAHPVSRAEVMAAWERLDYEAAMRTTIPLA